MTIDLHPAPPPPDGLRPERPTVLVVDDDPGVCAILTRFLQATCTTLTANNATAALQWLQARRDTPPRVELALVDIMMPGIDGLSLCRMIRSEYGLPVVICSARNSRGDVEEAMRRGANDFILKPFTKEIVLQKVHRWMGVAAPPARGADTLTTGPLTAAPQPCTVGNERRGRTASGDPARCALGEARFDTHHRGR